MYGGGTSDVSISGDDACTRDQSYGRERAQRQLQLGLKHAHGEGSALTLTLPSSVEFRAELVFVI